MISEISCESGTVIATGRKRAFKLSGNSVLTRLIEQLHRLTGQHNPGSSWWRSHNQGLFWDLFLQRRMWFCAGVWKSEWSTTVERSLKGLPLLFDWIHRNKRMLPSAPTQKIVGPSFCSPNYRSSWIPVIVNSNGTICLFTKHCFPRALARSFDVSVFPVPAGPSGAPPKHIFNAPVRVKSVIGKKWKSSCSTATIGERCDNQARSTTEIFITVFKRSIGLLHYTQVRISIHVISSSSKWRNL